MCGLQSLLKHFVMGVYALKRHYVSVAGCVNLGDVRFCSVVTHCYICACAG